jgi:flavin reductase (DIM6/NTAB) family NADH-FMN oxidoreductase RutF
VWNRPFVQVVVRPTRYTYEFIERYDTFTVCAFAETYRDALQLLGAKSGREGNKIVESGLHPIGSQKVLAPSFAEAELIIECQKIYSDDFDPKHFIDQTIDRNYPNKDYHRIYYGQILHVEGEDIYRGEERFS